MFFTGGYMICNHTSTKVHVLKKKILITDDDTGVQDIFRLILEKAGYEVVINDNGQDILDDRYDIPHIFLLDKQLSGIDGIDICKHLKTHDTTRNIPVIMISASPGFAPLAITAGADDCLEKPFQMKDLLSKVERLLNSQRAMNQPH